jgi:hypothetical protein
MIIIEMVSKLGARERDEGVRQQAVEGLVTVVIGAEDPREKQSRQHPDRSRP